ncbi:DUF1800 domain-containing protein [Ningiella sp. W23]|uniref:DUF1800 domain-containing protein n=1 Tax=Ningiella sp. W23 TaxID=3023715 RepID=UPI0037571DE7
MSSEMMSSGMPNEFAFIATNRFGYGADKRAQDFLQASSSRSDAQTWLTKQLGAYKLPTIKWDSAKALRAHYELKNERKKRGSDADNQTDFVQSRRAYVKQARRMAEVTALHNINHKQVIQSRLLDFFSNHFSVSRVNFPMRVLSPTLEIEAIAPNLHRTFSDMLLATIQHPAMLIYLNNEFSIGPNSKLGVRRKGKKARNGLNENLAREILELHTVGVDAGYSQDDVTELAKAITGWSIGALRYSEEPEFLFRSNAHEPGSRAIMGAVYNNKRGEATGRTILKHLANHESTARHVSAKLVRHFIADDAPSDIVDAMVQAWLDTNGHIPSVVSQMILHKKSWSNTPQKFKTPREFIISSMRAFNTKRISPSLFESLEIMGQGFFNSGSPAGYADTQSAWLSASALNARIEWASHFAALMAKRKSTEPVAIAQKSLGPFLQNNTLNAIKRAESKQMAISIFLLSPEFQRR